MALADLQAQLDRQVAAIVAALPDEAPVRESGDADLRQLGAVMKELGDLLADDDGRAEQLLVQHTALLKAALPALFQPLQEAVCRFDFEQALEVLAQACPPASNEELQ